MEILHRDGNLGQALALLTVAGSDSLPSMVQRDGAIWRSQRCPAQALSRGPGGSPPRPHTCCAAACARMGCASGRSCRRRCAQQSGNGGVTGEGALARIPLRHVAAWLPRDGARGVKGRPCYLPPVALRGLQHVPSLRPGAHRALAVSASKIAVTEPWWTRNNPENMADIHSVQEFVDELVRRRAALET